jgi:hypothetical protein
MLAKRTVAKTVHMGTVLAPLDLQPGAGETPTPAQLAWVLGPVQLAWVLCGGALRESFAGGIA